MDRPFLCEQIVIATAKLVDDSQVDKRSPTHSDLEQQFVRAQLGSADPARSGQPVGKAKRVRAVLYSALTNDPAKGEVLVRGILSAARACGGFRPDSINFCGAEAISNLRDAFQLQGWQLTGEGELQPPVLESLTGKALTGALLAYADRARRGRLDNPLLAGTAKDLLEAVSAHVLVQKWGSYSTSSNFPTMLGQAFVALNMATSMDPEVPGEHPRRKMERGSYQLACAINSLRNKEGTGHGRPWLSAVSATEARFAIECMGSIAAMMLDRLGE